MEGKRDSGGTGLPPSSGDTQSDIETHAHHSPRIRRGLFQEAADIESLDELQGSTVVGKRSARAGGTGGKRPRAPLRTL
jgi:hypothetical protein